MNWSKAKTIILKNNEVQNELKMNEAEYKIIEEHELSSGNRASLMRHPSGSVEVHE